MPYHMLHENRVRIKIAASVKLSLLAYSFNEEFKFYRFAELFNKRNHILLCAGIEQNECSNNLDHFFPSLRDRIVYLSIDVKI